MIAVNLLELYNSPFNHEDLLFTEGPLIYRIHNLITNKSYIGRTKVNLDYRFFSAWHYTHFDCYNDKSVNKHLYNSMRKYGLENFELSILSTNPEDEKIVLRQLLDTNLKSFIGLPNNEETVNKFKEEVHKIFEEFIGPVSTNLVNLVMDQYEAIIRKEISNYFINGTTS